MKLILLRRYDHELVAAFYGGTLWLGSTEFCPACALFAVVPDFTDHGTVCPFADLLFAPAHRNIPYVFP